MHSPASEQFFVYSSWSHVLLMRAGTYDCLQTQQTLWVLHCTQQLNIFYFCAFEKGDIMNINAIFPSGFPHRFTIFRGLTSALLIAFIVSQLWGKLCWTPLTDSPLLFKFSLCKSSVQ